MQNYFSYECHTDCGISKVKLLGTIEDWKHLREATGKLDEYGLDWWTKGLIDIFDNIIATFDGPSEKNAKFWKHIFKYY